MKRSFKVGEVLESFTTPGNNVYEKRVAIASEDSSPWYVWYLNGKQVRESAVKEVKFLLLNDKQIFGSEDKQINNMKETPTVGWIAKGNDTGSGNSLLSSIKEVRNTNDRIEKSLAELSELVDRCKGAPQMKGEPLEKTLEGGLINELSSEILRTATLQHFLQRLVSDVANIVGYQPNIESDVYIPTR